MSSECAFWNEKFTGDISILTDADVFDGRDVCAMNSIFSAMQLYIFHYALLRFIYFNYGRIVHHSTGVRIALTFEC